MELKDNILFDVGQAEIKEPSKAILDKINFTYINFSK
jgi:outer membrane protein OmpA-like peptidoglycan-associated protein